MILVIRISGQVEVPTDIEDTLFHMRLRKKFTAVLMKDNKETKSMLIKVRSFVAFGPIAPDTLVELIEKRAQLAPGTKKIDAQKVAAGLEKSSPEDLGIKPFFRLHPPRGGIDSKTHFPIRKGVLGDNKEKINDLVRRML